MHNNHVKKLVFTSLFMALIIVCTAYVSVPLPLVGYVHLGDAFIFLATFILGPLGVVAAGLGSAIADIIVYPAYAIATLVVKSLMSITAYAMYCVLKKLLKKTIISEILAGIVGTIVMALGYFIFEFIWILPGSISVAVNIPFSLLQGAIGVAIAVPIMRLLEKTKLLRTLTRNKE